MDNILHFINTLIIIIWQVFPGRLFSFLGGTVGLGDCSFSDARTGLLTLAPNGAERLALILLGTTMEGLADIVSLATPTIPPMARSPVSLWKQGQLHLFFHFICHFFQFLFSVFIASFCTDRRSLLTMDMLATYPYVFKSNLKTCIRCTHTRTHAYTNTSHRHTDTHTHTHTLSLIHIWRCRRWP